MPRLQATDEEVGQFRADPIAALIHENYVLFDLRRSQLDPRLSSGHHWTSEQLAMVRCLTASNVTIDRIIPSEYLPLSDDSELRRAFKELDIAIRHPSAESDFRGLPETIAELNSPTGSTLHRGEAILHSFCSGVSSRYEGSRLRKDLSIQHMIGSTAPLEWFMGGYRYPYMAVSSGFLFLESTIAGKTLQGPQVTQSMSTSPVFHFVPRTSEPCLQIYTELPEQVAVMLAIASGFCGFGGFWERQDVYQLTLDKPAILRINHIHFHARHLMDLMLAENLPAELYPFHLRRSIPFDLSKPEEVKQAARALMGLLRYLQSGEADISILKHSMRSDSAEGSSESEISEELARLELDEKRR